MTGTQEKSDDKNKSRRRARRTKAEIEKTLFEAATQIIIDLGFAGLTVTGIIQKAKIEPPVFYNRYTDLDDFIEKYVRNYDYWLLDTIDIDYRGANPLEKLMIILDDLIDSLVDNIPMQKLIAWEINETNHITKRTAQARDLTSSHIIEYFVEAFKNCEVKYNYSSSLFIGGIYYLIIHRQLGTFNFIDFTKEESISELKKNLRLILYKIFDDYNPEVSNSRSIEQIAKELLKNNVDKEIIKKSTGLDDLTLEKMLE